MSDAFAATPQPPTRVRSPASSPTAHGDAALRDALFAAAYAQGQTRELRREKLREAADLCEKKLGDVAGAAKALKGLMVLDPSDRSTRKSLADLLEANELWTDFALLLEREANIEVDVDKKVAMLRHLASLHETKRDDRRGAAEALACVANLIPAAEGTIAAAATAFERADAMQEAAGVIEGNLELVDDLAVRSQLLERLGGLRERLSDLRAAGQAYSRAAEASDSLRLWEMAERCHASAEQWEPAARAAVQCAYDSVEPKTRSRYLALAADHFGRAGDVSSALFNLELAVDIDPSSAVLAMRLAERYASAEQWAELVVHVVRVAGELPDPAVRVMLRRKAAEVSATRLADKTRARDLWTRLLEDGDDREALERLIEEAIKVGDAAEARKWIERLEVAALEGARESAEAWRIALRVKANPPTATPETTHPSADNTEQILVGDELAELMEPSSPDLPIDEAPLEPATSLAHDLEDSEKQRAPRMRKRSAPPPLPT